MPVYKNPRAPLESRVNDLFRRLTQDEKLTMLTGTAFTTTPIPRLGVPAMGMADAGQGVRGGMDGTLGPATLFPSGVAMASTWDPEMLRREGVALGEEVQNKGTGAQVLLGPAVNIHRSPQGGRNGEYASEDPYLAARLDVPYIQGLQSTGAAACVKHYACNNEEIDRGFVNVHVDERTLREIYLPAFEAAVKEGHVWTLMASYNKINGSHATANHYLLTDVLKDGWGFDGLVMSDWGAVHETAGTVRAGDDLEMPGPGLVSHDKLAKALKTGQVTQAQIDDSVKRILRATIRVGLLDGPAHTPNHALVNAPAHRQATLDAADEAITLLKNDGGLLPLPTSVKTLAVIGPRAKAWQMGASGSPSVDPIAPVSPWDGLVKRAGTGVKLVYAAGVDLGDIGVPIPTNVLTPPDGAGHGLRGEYFTGDNLEGTAKGTRTDGPLQLDWNTAAPGFGLARTHFSVRWTGTLTAPVSGKYTLAIMSDDGCRLVFDGKTLIDNWLPSSGAPRTATITLEAGHAYPIRCDYYQAEGKAFFRLNWVTPGSGNDSRAVSDAARVAANADMALVFVGSSEEGEGTDRPSLALPAGEDDLIEAVVKANPHTVVVLNNGTPCLMPWLPRVPALVEAWFPGEEGGTALASILFGDVNPSGHLTDTLGARREDYPDFGHFPGVKGQITYAEGLYVGYRHFDKAKIAPLFPFGHGLSYTTFRYANLKLSQPTWDPAGAETVTLDVTNTGARAGAEVVQLYVHDTAPQIDKPVRELKGFQRILLQPGQARTVSLPLTPRDLAYCDVPGKQWRADAGSYEIQIGASSRDIRQTAPLRLARTWTEPIPGLGAPPPVVHDPNDLAFGKPVKASASETADLGPENAVDGDESTRWSSGFADPQWIAVDLGKTQTIRRVRLTWEDAYAAAYQIQVSPDGLAWTDVYATKTGQGGVETADFKPTPARWVRVYCTKRVTQFGDSLFSLEVFK